MDLIIVKRGRPKKISEESKALAYQKFLNQKEDKEKTLCGLQLKYVQESFSDQIRKIIRKIPITASLPNFLKILPIVNLLEEAAKILMMNETELIAVSFVFSVDVNPEELVFVICFAAKVQMENDEELIEKLHQKMSFQIKGFNECLKTILEVATFSVSDLVKEYNKFDWKTETVNYLYYVDDVLRFCHPYQSYKRLDKEKKNKSIEKHKKSREGYQFKRVKKENFRIMDLEDVKGKFKREGGLMNKEITFEDLMPIEKVENDELKLDEVLDRGMNDYLKLDINSLSNDGLNEREHFDSCDEYFLEATF